MKVLIFSCLCATLLPAISRGNDIILREKLKEIAGNNESVDGIFRPDKDGGFLGAGAFSTAIKGTLLKPSQRDVAMKFTPFQDTTGFPFYDELYQIISEEIDKFNLPKPVLVSWITDEEKDKSKEEIKQLPDISTIQDRFENVDAEYPEVNYNYFAKLNEEKTISESFENDAKADLTKIASTTSDVNKVNENIFSRTLRWIKRSRKR